MPYPYGEIEHDIAALMRNGRSDSVAGLTLTLSPSASIVGPLAGAASASVFSVRRDPGIPWLSVLGMGPRIQIEIEAPSEAAPLGKATRGIQLEAVQDGGLLRAVGPSLQDPIARRASYTVTIEVGGKPG